MPHLSPMSWIMAIFMLWTTLSIMTSTFWWAKHHSFFTTANHTTSTPEGSWKWL
uniref:ATP synthase F0 subunit 8 n=1 Tax=Eisenia nordenskioldi TaxID=538895 RepID=UPI0021B57BC0|nr:ATP synthase F0 subunit 8 [Eisenia nordenskioldi]UIX22954.1 ATP synthase F0 subunit 8 [Eisenia nordenskioldi]UIX22967.1 ATP synthase F0 subunit 8 [Eisenia nordenskioldi]